MSGNNSFLAYGVVNDGGAPGERSGDGAYLPAMEERIQDPGTEAMTDREVLEALYHTTNGPNWNNRHQLAERSSRSSDLVWGRHGRERWTGYAAV